MTYPALDNLPAEIVLTINDLLPWEDNESLSLVSKKLRSHIVPFLFRHIKVDCPLSRDNVLQSVVHKYGVYVTKLRLNVEFQPNPPGSSLKGTKVDPKYSTEAWYWEDYPASVWAQDAADVPAMQDLVASKGLPNCILLSVHTNGEEGFEIEGGWDDNDLSDTSIYFCFNPESWEEVKRKEENYAWRKAWNELWHDIAKYSKEECVEFLHFLPIKASCWNEPVWSDFVGRLKVLTIRAYGQDNGAGWAVNTLDGFNAFFADMPDFLFQHAKNLEHLCIAGHEDGHLGEGSLGFVPGTMSQLRSLRLEGMAITKSLKDFLSGSTPKLESLHLDNVAAWGFEFSDIDSSSRREPTWAEFWKAVRKGNPMLEDVVFRYHKTPPLTEAEYMNDSPSFDLAIADTEREAQIRMMVADDDSLIIWPYITSNDKYGDILDWEETNLECLARGDDNKEYRLLLEGIERRQQSPAS